MCSDSCVVVLSRTYFSLVEKKYNFILNELPIILYFSFIKS